MKDKLLKEKENILNKQERQNKRLYVIEKELNQLEEESQKNWKPRLGDEYYFIDDEGSIQKRLYTNCTIDHCRIDLGNCFKNTFIAEFIREKLYVLKQLKEFSYDFSEEEWKDEGVPKYCMYLYSNTKEIQVFYTLQLRKSCFYFSSEEDAEEAINTIGADRLVKYYFGAGEANE